MEREWKWESEDFSQRSYNGIERGREREMEGTKDITRSYTNFIMYPYQCIYSRQSWIVFPFVASIATCDVELGSFEGEREGGGERGRDLAEKLVDPADVMTVTHSTPHGSLPRISDKGQSIDR